MPETLRILAERAGRTKNGRRAALIEGPDAIAIELVEP